MQHIKNGTPLRNAFALHLYDHVKCDGQTVQVHVKSRFLYFLLSHLLLPTAAPAAYAQVVPQRYRKLVDTCGGSDTSPSVRSGEGRPAKPIQALPEVKLKPEYSMFLC